MRFHHKKSPHAATLRKMMTEAEKRLWYFLQRENLSCKFRRQVPLGAYIVDFASLDHSLVIEVDGGQHNGNPMDRERDDALQAEGFTVLRFWNHDIFQNIEGVLHRIREALEGAKS